MVDTGEWSLPPKAGNAMVDKKGYHNHDVPPLVAHV